MSNNHSTRQYKTLDIIKFYTQAYEFVSKYLVFVIAAISSAIIILALWIGQPTQLTEVISNTNTGYKLFHQEDDLIHPLNYYAAKELVFDTSSRIYALGGPIWSKNEMINSIDNIVYYNGIILPRQISKSARVPQFESENYSESMINTLLEGMGESQVNLEEIVVKISKPIIGTLNNGLINTFGLQCTKRTLLTHVFCDLKVLKSISSWHNYDLSNSIVELTVIHNYIATQSKNTSLMVLFCESAIRQYRYTADNNIKSLLNLCSKTIIKESDDISQLKEINGEIDTINISNKVYSNPVMNRYKLMSIYQYLMKQINNNEFSAENDYELLTSYDAFITSLANQKNIIQPYADIILVFHQSHLMPRLQERDTFASSSQKELTKQLTSTTSLLFNGDSDINFESLTKSSKLNIGGGSIEGINNNPTIGTGDTSIYTTGNNITGGSFSNNTGGLTGEINLVNDIPLPSLSGLIMKVVGTNPNSITKKGNLIIIKFSFGDIGRIAAVDSINSGSTQLYYDSPTSGATKITHPPLLFQPINQDKIHVILERYIQNKLVSGNN